MIFFLKKKVSNYYFLYLLILYVSRSLYKSPLYEKTAFYKKAELFMNGILRIVTGMIDEWDRMF